VSEATARRDKTVPRQSNHTGTVDPAAKSNDTMSGVGDAEPPPILRLLKADEHRHRLRRERAARSPFALPLFARSERLGGQVRDARFGRPGGVRAAGRPVTASSSGCGRSRPPGRCARRSSHAGVGGAVSRRSLVTHAGGCADRFESEMTAAWVVELRWRTEVVHAPRPLAAPETAGASDARRVSHREAGASYAVTNGVIAVPDRRPALYLTSAAGGVSRGAARSAATARCAAPRRRAPRARRAGRGGARAARGPPRGSTRRRHASR
jgi:hypothetical protein